ncbi:MAG: thymidine kinase [Oligoflexia bacterium]|nr:thymidine kinase [Oligoflexia bacterium]MBF0366246.1 thymidine kinase [Oligoflexia bacterium]
MPNIPSFHNFSAGHLEVIAGPMFSGKTEELIRRVRRAQIARVKVQVFRHAMDTRYDDSDVVSHSAQSLSATPIKSAIEIFQKLYDSTRIVAIDEVQFLGEDIIPVVKKLTCRGYRVICAGLDLDYRGIPFGPMPILLALADEIVKVHAICTICGGIATRTQRLIESEAQVVVGAKESYAARCRAHHDYNPAEEDLLPHKDELSDIYSLLPPKVSSLRSSREGEQAH